MFLYQLADIVISIHAPAKGATSSELWSAESERHFNPRSREGSDAFHAGNRKRDPISIHAPAKGATAQAINTAFEFLFQSTLPRRERQL